METNKKNTHGGKRSGAGRPRKLGTPTSVIRVPSYRKRNIEIEVDMFHSHIKEKPYNYSASEIYEVVSDLIFLLRSFQDRISEGKIKGLEELTPFQRYELLNIKSQLKD
jgi:hypothetical protein